MDWKIEYWADLEILYVQTSGVLTSDNVNPMVADVVTAMVHHKCRKQIVDHRKTKMELSVLEYYQRPDINTQIGISRTWRIAMIFKERTENTQFMETVFINRGFNFKQFTDLEEAKQWLLS
jgi:hypothetical protein